MKQIYLHVIFLLLVGIQAQAQTLSYNQRATATGADYLANGLETTIDYLSTCQESVTATFDSRDYGNGIWSGGDFDYYVNGTLAGSGSGVQTIDLTSFIPVTSVQMRKTNSANWNEVHLTVLIDLPADSFPDAPVVSDVFYCQNAVAVPLTATLSAPGVGLKWYTTEAGAGFSTTAPTPSTTTLGTVSYWVAQEDADGCESERSVIEVHTVINDTQITQNGNELSVAQAGATYQWGICQGSTFTPIVGATTQTYMVDAIGSYAVDVTLGTCTSRSACFDITTLNTASFDSSKISVYPNPVQQNLFIDLGDSSKANLIFFDVNGRRILEINHLQSNQGIDVSSLTPGFYLLQMETSNGIFKRKIIKQ